MRRRNRRPQRPKRSRPRRPRPGSSAPASTDTFRRKTPITDSRPSTADREGLHLEARYNYEGIGTGSAWVGWNVGVGDKLRLDATLMAGGIFGDFNGVAPGYHLTISWGPLELYSEGEYVFDLDDSESNYFYNWAQLGYSPWEWLTIGFASQRTRAYETGLDVQRGPFVAFTYKSTTLAVYVFNGDAQPPTVVASLAVSF